MHKHFWMNKTRGSEADMPGERRWVVMAHTRTVTGSHFLRFLTFRVQKQALLFFIYQDLPGLPMALRVSGRLTVLPTS